MWVNRFGGALRNITVETTIYFIIDGQSITKWIKKIIQEVFPDKSITPKYIRSAISTALFTNANTLKDKSMEQTLSQHAAYINTSVEVIKLLSNINLFRC